MTPQNLRPPIPLERRLRIIGTAVLVVALVGWKNSSEGYTLVDGWAKASRDLSFFVWVAMLDVLRQAHYLLGESSKAWWEMTLRAEARVEKMRKRVNPWTRHVIASWAKRVFVFGILSVVLAKVWGIPVASVPGELPARLMDVLFSTAGNLPMIFQLLLMLGIAIGQFLAIFWFLSRGGVEELSAGEVKTRFQDVWGQDHVLERVRENVAFLNEPETIEERGGYVPGGVLLWGPPGTGKTLMAEAIAGECSKPYVFVDPGAFQAMFFGVGIMKVKRLFKRLRKLALRYGGVVVFFDEADTLGNRGQGVIGRSGSTALDPTRWEHARWMSAGARAAILSSANAHGDGGEVERERRRSLKNRVVMGFGGTGELQILLSELSGLSKPRGFWGKTVRKMIGMRLKPAEKHRILAIFATNLPDVLDPALLRPGRVDRRYHVGYPNLEGRVRTYEGYLSKVAHDLSAEQVKRLATSTPYATGASIKDLVNEAVIHSVRRGGSAVTWDDIQTARHARELGEADAGEYIQRERYSVALHEACHAVAAVVERKHLSVDVATIQRRGAIGGLVGSIPPEDRFTHWSSEYRADLVVSLASIAGEELFFEEHTSGVGGDLQQATRLAETMAGRWGMGRNLRSREKVDGTKGADDHQTVGAPGDEIEEILLKAQDRAREILEAHRADVLAVCHALEEHRTISGVDVEAVMNRTHGEKVDGTKYDAAAIEVLEAYHQEVVAAIREARDVAVEWSDLNS